MTKVKISWSIEEEGVGIKAVTSDGKEFFIVSPLDEMDRLQMEIDGLCRAIQQAFEKGRDEWVLYKNRKENTTSEHENPQSFWEMLKREPKENMIRLFNAQSETMRKLVAQYVFENVNVFSGAGAVFAELYDQETSLLET